MASFCPSLSANIFSFRTVCLSSGKDIRGIRFSSLADKAFLSTKAHASSADGPLKIEASEKFLSIEEILKEAEDEDDNFIFSEKLYSESESDDLTADPFSRNASSESPSRSETNAKVPGSFVSVLPSAADMEKVLSAYSTSSQVVENLTVSDLNAILADEETRAKITLVDVRGVGEFKSGHVPGAINFPLPGIAQKISDGSVPLVEDKSLVFICQGGVRSANAANLAISLVKNPNIKIVNILGGTGAWISQGFPVSYE